MNSEYIPFDDESEFEAVEALIQEKPELFINLTKHKIIDLFLCV